MTSQPRALVVDDDDSIRSMLAMLVRRENITVDTARDGAEALEMIDADGYGVIVLDLMMPRVDGFAVLEHLKNWHPEKLACTIVASAVPESEILGRVSLPVRLHTKPFDLPVLLEQIRSCVAGPPA